MFNPFVGYNQEKIQSINRSLVLKLLCKEGVCSRAQLAKLSQLKQATITNMMNDFINCGLVKEVGFLTGDRGRRSIGVSINNEDFGVLAVRIARKNYSVGIFDLSGNSVIVNRRSIPPQQAPANTIEKIIRDGNRLIAQCEKRRIIAVGVALPGPYSTKTGRIEIMTGVLGWNKIPVKELFEEHFRLPVFIEQDANAAALAQYWNSSENLQNQMLVYIAIGQGVGAGIINNGEILRGTEGIAGEIGHTCVNFNGPPCACGNRGCLENYCSSIAFSTMVNEALKPKESLSFSDIVLLMKSGNETVKEEFLKTCDILSIGVVNIINSFNPSIVVLGDEMSHIAPKLMLTRVTENVKEHLLPEIYKGTKISLSLTGRDSMVHGAAIVAIAEIFANTGRYFPPV